MASFTVATITSPTRAYQRREPPNTLIQSADLAPVLSAIRRIDSCWIISLSLYLPVVIECRSSLALDELVNTPALGLGQRARFDDPHGVTDLVLVALIMSVELL